MELVTREKIYLIQLQEKKETMNKNGKDWDKGTEEINEIKIISIHWFNKLNQRRSHNERTN